MCEESKDLICINPLCTNYLAVSRVAWFQTRCIRTPCRAAAERTVGLERMESITRLAGVARLPALYLAETEPLQKAASWKL